MIQDQDLQVKFGGRTLLVECTFIHVIDLNVLASRMRTVVAGPLLRMICGSVEKRGQTLVTKTFVNTDEEGIVVASRVREMNPAPTTVTIGDVNKSEAKKIWTALQKAQGN